MGLIYLPPHYWLVTIDYTIHRSYGDDDDDNDDTRIPKKHNRKKKNNFETAVIMIKIQDHSLTSCQGVY